MIKQTLSQTLDKPNPLAKKTSNTPKQILVKILKKTNPLREAQTKHIQNPKQTLNKTLNKTNPAWGGKTAAKTLDKKIKR